jgi:hypothetical protein
LGETPSRGLGRMERMLNASFEAKGKRSAGKRRETGSTLLSAVLVAAKIKACFYLGLLFHRSVQTDERKEKQTRRKNKKKEIRKERSTKTQHREERKRSNKQKATKKEGT